MKDSKKYTIIFIVLLVICFLYLGASSTYTAYESLVDGNVKTPTAKFKLYINGISVTGDGTLSDQIIVDNVTWTSTHTRDEKISPGSYGTVYLELDPTQSDVAVMYSFQFIDKRIDDDKVLTFNNITADSGIVRTAKDTYSGIVTLDDINDGKKINISADFIFDYLNDIVITDDYEAPSFEDLFEIHFHAVQYRGEELVPYTE